MHTNFDVKGMADLAAAMLGLERYEVLDVTAFSDGREEGIGRAGDLMEPMTLECCAAFVKAAFSLQHVKVFGNKDDCPSGRRSDYRGHRSPRRYRRRGQGALHH